MHVIDETVSELAKEAAVALQGWIDPSTHWKATGQVDSSGKMTGGTVTDNNGTVRTRDKTFDSEQSFKAWVKTQ